ncbi:MAG: hypothetical protein U5L01_03980 [Rheinheimera sp.]|nr:hypothetical protein [Rheinheimera sp.]
MRDKLNALVPQAPTPISKTALNPNLKADLNAEDSIASTKTAHQSVEKPASRGN